MILKLFVHVAGSSEFGNDSHRSHQDFDLLGQALEDLGVLSQDLLMLAPSSVNVNEHESDSNLD